MAATATAMFARRQCWRRGRRQSQCEAVRPDCGGTFGIAVSPPGVNAVGIRVVEIDDTAVVTGVESCLLGDFTGGRFGKGFAGLLRSGDRLPKPGKSARSINKVCPSSVKIDQDRTGDFEQTRRRHRSGRTQASTTRNARSPLAPPDAGFIEDVEQRRPVVAKALFAALAVEAGAP